LGLRIPKSYSTQAGITDGSKININMDGVKIVISTIQKDDYEMNELLSMVNEDNLHCEIDTDGPIGNEIGYGKRIPIELHQ